MKVKKERIKKKKTFKQFVKEFFQWGSFSVFFACVVVIFAESAIPGTQSGQQSGNMAGEIEDQINDNYDKENIIDITGLNFEVAPNQEDYFIGDVLTYTVSYVPENTSFKTLIWEVSNPELVKLDETDCTITCLAAGTTDITVKSQKHSELKQTFTVNIKEIPVSSIEINVENVELNINDIHVINTTVYPENATNKGLTFVSSDSNVATVDTSGVVTAKSAGTAEILVTSVSNTEATKTLFVKVKETISYEVNSITFPDISIYPSQTVTQTGTFGPVASNFNFNNLSIEKVNDNSNIITINKKNINAAKNTFTLEFKCKNSAAIQSQEIEFKLTYTSLEGTFVETSVIKVNELNEITPDLVNEAKLVTSYKGNIYENIVYNASNKTSDSITISIPYTSEVTSSAYKYNKTTYAWDSSTNVKLSSKSYNKVVISLKTNEATDGWVTFKPNKNYDTTYTFTFEYVLQEDNSKISDITFTKLYTQEIDNKVNELYIDSEYEDILSHKIVASGGKFNKSFESTGTYITISENSKDIIEFLKNENNETIGLKTLNNTGSAEILVVSKFEKDLGIENPMTRTIKINVSSKPNKSVIKYNDSIYEDLNNPIVVDRNVEFYIDYQIFNVVTLKNGTTYENELFDTYKYEVSTSDIITYNNDSHIVQAIDGGTTSITFSFDDPELAYLTKTISIKVNYTPIIADLITFTYEQEHQDKYNKPNEDYSKVPVGIDFRLVTHVNEDATIKTVNYLSSNPEVATIDVETGYIHTVRPGKTTIKVFSVDNPEIYKEKEITVTNSVSPFKITFDDNNEGAWIKYLKPYNDDKGNLIGYNIGIYSGKTYTLKIDPLFECTSTSYRVGYLDNSEEHAVSIDTGGNISTIALGKTSVKITFGEDDSLQHFSYIVNFEVIRDTIAFSKLHTLIRKLFGHYGLFLCTALTGMIFICLTFNTYLKKIIASLVYSVIGFAVAGFSELIQKFTPGRGPSWKDVSIDFGGFMTTVGAFIIVFLLIILIKYIIRKVKHLPPPEKPVKVDPRLVVQKDCKSEAQYNYEYRKLEKKLKKEKKNKRKRK